MGILGKTGQSNSITEGRRALDLFVDRSDAIRRFASYLNDDQPRKQLLFFYGDGGNGKSLLLRYLREICCKRLPRTTWQQLRGITSDRDFVSCYEQAEGSTQVPHALLDFGLPPRGYHRPREAFSALLMLRCDLAGYGLRFPLFDFACVWHLYKRNQVTYQRLRSLFPAEEMDVVSSIAGAVGAIGKAVVGVFGKHLSNGLHEKYTLWAHSHNLDQEQVDQIRRMEAEPELMDRLPELFARDLNAEMSRKGAPERLVLFFDTHEAFWGDRRDLVGGLFFQRDEWLRRLLGAVNLKDGIVVVVVGRDEPKWAQAKRSRLPAQYLDLRQVGFLPRADARLYLERAKIPDGGLQDSLLAYAQVAPDQVHPLYLGLCADIVLAASGQGKRVAPADFQTIPEAMGKSGALVDRLLCHMDRQTAYAVRSLCACRAFDPDIYSELGKALGTFQPSQAEFDLLTEFSFVWRTERSGKASYRVHDLLRRLMRDRGDDMVRRADKALETLYRGRWDSGDASAVSEAIYHANRVDPRRGADEWIRIFDASFDQSQYDLCNALLEVRPLLVVDSDLQRVAMALSAGDYCASLGRYAEATEEFGDAIAPFDRVLHIVPEDAAALNIKGIALQRLGDLQATRSLRDQALESYGKAIAAYDEAIRRAPDQLPVLNNKGIVLQRLGDFQATLSLHDQGLGSYGKAIAAFDEALRRAHDDLQVLDNKGIAIQRLGDLQTTLSLHEQALESYGKAIAAYDEALRRAPYYVNALNDKASVLERLALLLLSMSRRKDAVVCLMEAIALLEKSQTIVRDDPRIAARLRSLRRKLEELGKP